MFDVLHIHQTFTDGVSSCEKLTILTYEGLSI